jgi:hypothetical protein
MGNWGSDNFAGSTTTNGGLQGVIDQFPAGLKQAMFAAASRTTIKRKNWNGCAMNAAGIEVGKSDSVKSLEAAAEAFHISTDLVQKFISRWDAMMGTDEECTQKLREMIEKAGLFNEPGSKKHEARIVSVTVYKQLRAELDELIETHQVPDEDVALSVLDGSLAGV